MGAIAYLATGKDSRRLKKMDLSGRGPRFSWDLNLIKKLARENEISMGGERVVDGYRKPPTCALRWTRRCLLA